MTIFNTVLYQNSYFYHVFGAFVLFCTIFTLHSWHMFLMYLDVKGEICPLMIISFYLYSLSCTVIPRLTKIIIPELHSLAET